MVTVPVSVAASSGDDGIALGWAWGWKRSDEQRSQQPQWSFTTVPAQYVRIGHAMALHGVHCGGTR